MQKTPLMTQTPTVVLGADELLIQGQHKPISLSSQEIQAEPDKFIFKISWGLSFSFKVIKDDCDG